MNCFPCRGPACNSCGKFDRINRAVAESGSVRCRKCGGTVDLSTGRCRSCATAAFAPPGTAGTGTR